MSREGPYAMAVMKGEYRVRVRMGFEEFIYVFNLKLLGDYIPLFI
jgi:hypothetical protein